MWVLSRLASAYRELGDAKKAKPISERALAIAKRHYAEDHIDVAGISADLGIINGDLNEPEPAILQLKHARNILRMSLW